MHLAGGSFCLTEDMREADVPSVFKVFSSPQAVLLGICFLKTAKRISRVKKAPSWKSELCMVSVCLDPEAVLCDPWPLVGCRALP